MKKMVIVLLIVMLFVIPQLVMAHCHGPHSPKTPNPIEQK